VSGSGLSFATSFFCIPHGGKWCFAEKNGSQLQTDHGAVASHFDHFCCGSHLGALNKISLRYLPGFGAGGAGINRDFILLKIGQQVIGNIAGGCLKIVGNAFLAM